MRAQYDLVNYKVRSKKIKRLFQALFLVVLFILLTVTFIEGFVNDPSQQALFNYQVEAIGGK